MQIFFLSRSVIQKNEKNQNPTISDIMKLDFLLQLQEESHKQVATGSYLCFCIKRMS